MDESGPEELFESLLVRGNQFDLIAFDELIAEHSAHADALRRLRDEYEDARKGLRGAAPSENPAAASGVSFFGRQRRQAPELPVGVSVGQELAGFRLIELIGQGGMGQVWRAEQVSILREVALKLVRPEMVTPKTLDMFAREARAGARLRHPGIVDVIDHGTAEGIAWIAMEFVDGTWTLRDFLNDVGQQDELPAHYYRDVGGFGAQLADAMEAVHAQGVIHRDLKPQNILIAPDDTPKITDFGLARITDESALSMTGQVMGTYYYMSPEQLEARRRRIDHRTDIFSLGIVLYEILSGRRPFEGDTTDQIATQIKSVDPPNLRVLRSRIPRDLAVITGKCLEKEPDRRYESMAELAADLRRHLNHEPIHATPPGRARKAWLWTQRNPTKSVAGGVAALAFGVISLLLVNNVRTNRALSRTVGQRNTAIGELGTANKQLGAANEGLETANEDLAEQTRVAESAAAAEKARADEVLRLSALQDYEDLIAAADRLWPAHPENIEGMEEWIGKAQKLVDELPRHRAKLLELRTMAIPQTDAERAEERATHPDLPRLEAVEGELRWLQRALRRRRDGSNVNLPTLSPKEMALDASAAHELARLLVGRASGSRGDEPRGLALALRALTLSEATDDAVAQSRLGHTVAWGLALLGRDEEARAASALAFERAAASDKAEFSKYLTEIKKYIEAASSATGLAASETKLGELKAERSSLVKRVNARRDWSFPETEEGTSARWWHANLSALIASMERLEEPKEGLLSSQPRAVSAEHGWSMRRRLVFAKRVEEELQESAANALRWQEAISSIRASERYGNLQLVPQAGLVPIGPDPESGLWEFWHQATGEEPSRGRDNKLILTEDIGVVLVLIPGDKFWMGATAKPRAHKNFDPQAEPNEGPVHQVELTAYFLSKYELTQGQWQRFVGHNPSYYRAPSSLAPSLLHPVERVSWDSAMEVLNRMCLLLPSEAQWENGCRGGTQWPWSTGTERESLQRLRAANLADQAAARMKAAWPTIKDWPELDDGFAVHAPAGAYAANPYGLHEVHGNVWEWCLDGYDPEFYESSSGANPVSPIDDAVARVARGGGFDGTAAYARSARRHASPPTYASGIQGIRPAKAITW